MKRRRIQNQISDALGAIALVAMLAGILWVAP